MLRVDAHNPDPGAIRAAVVALGAGELVILPTDTVYGLAADPRVDGAEEKIFGAKTRDRNKPIPLLAGSLEDIERSGARLDPVARRLAQHFWPGPLTLVLPVGSREEGFRIPAHAVTLAVLRAAGTVLRVTSANRSGDPPACRAADALQALHDRVGVVLDAGPSPGGQPSTVVKLYGAELRILREGALPLRALQEAMGMV